MNPPPFSLRQLQYAVAVADTGGFRRASERCHVSQPSLSAQLAQLERALGARLFERDRRRVLVTSAGEELVARARQVLVSVDDLAIAARRLGDPLGGTLRVGVIPTVSPYLLPEIVPTLRASYPALTLLWHEEKTEHLLRELEAGNLDAAVMAKARGTEAFQTALIAQDAFVLAAPVGHPLTRSKRPAHTSDLEGQQVLLLEDGHCFREQALAVCGEVGARENDFRATSLATLAQVVAGGGGVTLLPTLCLGVENRRGKLALRRFASPAPGRTLVLVWRKQSPRGPGLRALAEVMRRAYPATP